MKETDTTHWRSPNTGASNKYGLTALPDGAFYKYSFEGINSFGQWWADTATTAEATYSVKLIYNSYDVDTADDVPLSLFYLSVRCIWN
jgi:hypothetical protein